LTWGQVVTLRGEVGEPTVPKTIGLGGHQVLRAGPDTAVRLTADAVAREYAADAAKAQKKYAGKAFVVEGIIRAVEQRENGDTALVFEGGPERTRAVALVGAGFREKKLLASVARGQRWSAQGLAPDLENGEVVIRDPYIMIRGE